MIPHTPESLPFERNEKRGGTKAYSCLPCRERKIKCDRCNPCSHCIKSNRECSFVAPVRGKRKRVKPAREGLHARLRRYEELLRSLGVNVESALPAEDRDSPDFSPRDTAMSDDGETPNRALDIHALDDNSPKLVTRQGSSRYYDSALWSHLGDDFDHPENDSSDDSAGERTDEEELLFEAGSTEKGHLPLLHPPSEVTHKLKEYYIERCDPLMKILHLPTFWILLSETQQNPYDVQKSSQALVFAVYLAAISSLDEHECQSLFGLESSLMLSRYTSASRRALIDAKFLTTSSLTTLSAFCIYLMCARNSHRGDALYVLSGLALRLARKIGLHRDGTSLGLAPFETELRRRLWWHVVMVDFRTSDVQGVRPSLDLTSFDTKMILNVEDDDLFPGMMEPPTEREAILPVSLALIRCEMSETIRKFSTEDHHGLRWEVLSSPDVPLSRKDAIIDDLETYFESRYLRHYDPSNGLHTFISIMIRSGICKMRLFAYRPPKTNPPTQTSKEMQDKAFANAVKLLQYITFMHGDNGTLRNFKWQTGASYLWITMLYVLIEIRRRKTGPEVEKVWTLIGTVLSGYSQVFSGAAGNVFMALNKWILDVWDEYVTASINENLVEPATPEYIVALRQARERRNSTKKDTPASGDPMTQTVFAHGIPDLTTNGDRFPDLPSAEEFDFSNFENYESGGNDWAQWSQLFNERGNF